MNRKSHITTTLATVLAALTLSACDGIAPDGEDLPRKDVTETIAAVTLEDGSQFRFVIHVGQHLPSEIDVASRQRHRVDRR